MLTVERPASPPKALKRPPPKPSGKTPVFTSRMRSKLAKFAFTEPEAAKGGSSPQKAPAKEEEQKENVGQTKKKSGVVDFTGMDPDDWGLANIDVDFDL